MTIREYNNDAFAANTVLPPSAPTYDDLLNDDFTTTPGSVIAGQTAGTTTPTEATTTPTATALSNESDDSSFNRESALVNVPSSNVFVDETSNNNNHYNHYSAGNTTVTTIPAPLVSPIVDSSVVEGRETMETETRYFRGKRVKAKNSHLPDDVLAFKENRKTRTAISTWTGGVVGLFVFGPLGAAVGAGSAYAMAKGVGKNREHRLIRKCEREGRIVEPPLPSSYPRWARVDEPVRSGELA